MAPIALIVGLGNPGEKYARTRHNIGFMLVDALAAAHGWSWQSKSRYPAQIAAGLHTPDETPVWLMKPDTFMNRSGEAVARFSKDKNLLPEQILVIHDELDFYLGKIKGASDRGAAGHNGVQSIIDHLGGKNFYRIRFGIGKAPSSDQSDTAGADYVLAGFRPEEKKQLDRLIADRVKGMDVLLETGSWDRALALINTH